MRYYELDFEWDWNYNPDEEEEVWDKYDKYTDTYTRIKN